MPPQATKDWLSLLQEKARERDIYVDTDISGRIFHFHLGKNPGLIGKVRYSEEKSRDYENEQGQKHIWHRYNREKELIEQGSVRKVVNVTLDVWEKDEFNPDDHHFIFLTEDLIREETYSQGDQKIWIEGDGRYSGPLAKYVNDWDAIFDYSTGADSPSSGASPNDGFSSGVQVSEDTADRDTSGTISETLRTQVQVSNRFKREVFEKYDHHCPLSGIEDPDLLTISHILGRAENQNLAEDIENVILIDWTHHMAFDSNLWTFDESGRLWVKPGFETESETLNKSLIDRHGEKVEEFMLIADEYIERHNADLDWWPPR